MSEVAVGTRRLGNLSRLMQRVGLDRAILLTLVGRFWNSAASIVSIVIIAQFLSIEEQGYYYTFGSVIGLQVFFELGLAFVIMQSASHERASLVWSEAALLVGGAKERARLASLLRLATTWYGVISLLFVLFGVPVGIYFFSGQQKVVVDITWVAPWVWLVLITAGNLNLSPQLAFFEGCGRVEEVALIRVLQGVIGTACFWVALVGGFKLYALPVMNTASLCVGVYLLCYRKRRFFRDIWQAHLAGVQICWWSEVWPFQWRIALSWLSGYFIFQLFTPVLFKFQGPAEAGCMGMSITVTGAISTIALAWVTTKSPAFGRHAALREIEALDKLFFRAFWQAVWISIVFVGVCVTGVMLLNAVHSPYARRLLPPLPFALLAISAFANVIISSEAIYLRSFKEEPFLVVSLLNGLFVGISTYLFGKYSGVTGMMAGYLVINTVVGLGLGTRILSKKRRQLRKELAQCV